MASSRCRTSARRAAGDADATEPGRCTPSGKRRLGEVRGSVRAGCDSIVSRARRAVRRRRRTTESLRAHAIEELARPRELARALVEVGERVPEPEVVLLRRASRRRPRRSSVAIASLQAARVGERAGEHDAALGHERARRRRLPRAPPRAPRPWRSCRCARAAVHEHRVLLDRAGEVGERRRAPWSRPGTGPSR